MTDGPTSHGSYSHTRNSEKAQVTDLGLWVGGEMRGVEPLTPLANVRAAPVQAVSHRSG